MSPRAAPTHGIKEKLQGRREYMRYQRLALVLSSIVATLAILSQTSAANQLSRAAPPPAATIAPMQAPSQNGSSTTSDATLHILDKADVEAWLDGIVPYALKSGGIAGGVVVKNGRLLLAKGYGYDDVSKRILMDPDRTMVRIGSTSNLFTWTAVMQSGKLDLDRDVNGAAYVDVIQDGDKLTLRGSAGQNGIGPRGNNTAGALRVTKL